MESLRGNNQIINFSPKISKLDQLITNLSILPFFYCRTYYGDLNDGEEEDPDLASKHEFVVGDMKERFEKAFFYDRFFPVIVIFPVMITW